MPALTFSAFYIVGWLVLRGVYRSQYAPRTYLQVISEKDRTPSTAASGVSWYKDYARLDDIFVLRHHSFDAFLYLRFFRMIILICGMGCLLTWPILLPVNARGGGSGQQLDKLAFGNVAQPRKCWAHAIVAILFLSFVMLIVNRERIFLINFRQAYVCTKSNAQRLSSRTVLFLSVPGDVFENGHFEQIFGDKISRTWKISNMEDLQGLVTDRSNAGENLEDAEMVLQQDVVARRGHDRQAGHTNGNALERGDVLALSGQRLDQVDLILDNIAGLNKAISKLREKHSKDSDATVKAIFIEFTDQLSAHQAYQQVQHHLPLSLQPRAVGIPPGNVNWSNLTLDPAHRISYSYVAIAVVIATTIFWAIPVSIVGTLSNIKYLADTYPWLRWINKLPGPIVAFVEGFLPPYALSTLTSYVPKWFRYVAERAGAPTKQSAEAFTQRSFFTFQFIQVFLVTTLSAGAATIVKRIADQPGHVPQFLAANLPKSSTFYLTYFILQGLNGCSGDLIKYEDTIEYLFYKWFWTRTPREKYQLEIDMKGLFYASKYSKFTNMAAIAVVYSCIAPLVLGFATVGFTFFYLTQRYLLLYTNNAKLETKGDCHARALQQILTGVYVAELCLIGLFGALNAKGPSAVMTIFLILTALQHYTVNRYLGPLEAHVPLDILQAAADEHNKPGTNSSERYTDESSEPLLSLTDTNHSQSHRRHLQHLAEQQIASLPALLRDPLQRMLEPRFFTSFEFLCQYLEPDKNDEGGSWMQIPTYTESQLKNAYVPPAMKEGPPLIWIPKDSEGVSEALKERNKVKAELQTSDEAASLNKDGHLTWDEMDVSKAPIFKLPTRF